MILAVESSRAWRADLLDMARIAMPIVFINLGIQAMGVVDALMVGKLGGAAIAAVALGNFYFFNASVFGMGLLCAIDPVVAQAFGAGDLAPPTRLQPLGPHRSDEMMEQDRPVQSGPEIAFADVAVAQIHQRIPLAVKDMQAIHPGRPLQDGLQNA